MLFGDSRTDILFHGHGRKEGIILEHITDLPLLGLNVNPLIGIQEQAVSIENPTLLGRYDPCRHKIPKTKQSRVATMPVFREIKRGLQSRDYKMSVHVSMCYITLAYSTSVSKYNPPSS